MGKCLGLTSSSPGRCRSLLWCCPVGVAPVFIVTVCSLIAPFAHVLLLIEPVDIIFPVVVDLLPRVSLSLLPSVIRFLVYVSLPVGHQVVACDASFMIVV